MPLEATLAVCVGFNLALALLIIAYIVSLRVNPDDFRWLQPKAKARATLPMMTASGHSDHDTGRHTGELGDSAGIDHMQTGSTKIGRSVG